MSILYIRTVPLRDVRCRKTKRRSVRLRGCREELRSVFSLYASPLPDPTVPFHANLELVEPTPDATKYPRHGNLTPGYRYTHPSPSFRSRCMAGGREGVFRALFFFIPLGPRACTVTRPSLYCRSFRGWCSLYTVEDDRENDKEKGEESLTGTGGGWRPPAVGRGIGWVRVGGSEMSAGIERKGAVGGGGVG